MGDTAWERGKAYTAMLAKWAEEAAAAAAAAAAAVKVATMEVARAQRAVDAAKTAAATWAAVQQLAAAEAALAEATALAAELTAAAEVAAAVAAGATLGTLVGQGLRGLWTWAFEILVMQLWLPATPGAYVPMSRAETEALLPKLLHTATGREFTRKQILDTGKPGEAAWDYAAVMVQSYVNTARAAATAGSGNRDEFLERALPDLKASLRDVRNATLEMSHHLESAGVRSGSEMKELSDKSVELITEVREGLDTSKPDQAKAHELCGTAIVALGKASVAFGEIRAKPVVGVDGFVPEMTVEEFRAFVRDCRERGASAIPKAEIALCEALLEASGVVYEASDDIGTLLAKYDAEGDDRAEEALFGPRGSLSLADYLRRSALKQSPNGVWLGIIPEESALVSQLRRRREDRAAAPGRVPVTTLDGVLGSFRLPGRVVLATGGGRTVAVDRPTSIREIAIRHANGDVGRVLDANPKLMVPVRTIRGFLSGNGASAGRVESITSGVTHASSSAATPAGAIAPAAMQSALTILLRAIADASAGGAPAGVTAGAPYASTPDEAIVLLPPETVATPQSSEVAGHTHAPGGHAGDGHPHAQPRNGTGARAGGLADEVLGASIDGGLPPN